MRKLLATVWLLYAANLPINLDREYRALQQTHTELAMVTIVAQHTDGTPAKGFISCAKGWFKHGEGAEDSDGDSEEGYAFATDSRGAVIFNPPTRGTPLSVRSV